MRHPLIATLCFLAVTVSSRLARAQEPGQAGGAVFARIVTLQPKPGLEAAFEAGYKRHLAPPANGAASVMRSWPSGLEYLDGGATLPSMEIAAILYLG